MTVLLNKEGGGQEEGPAPHSHKGTEQEGELEGAELPQVGVCLPQRIRHLREKEEERAIVSGRPVDIEECQIQLFKPAC